MPADTGYFTIEQARALMPEVRTTAASIIEVRADLMDLRAALAVGEPSPLGGMAELKAFEARLDSLLAGLAADGIQIKGWAPLLIDFPARLDGRDVLLCWLEGEGELAWYHPVELGFPGRRRLP